MSDTAIRVENLSKQYQIGQLHRQNDTLRDAIMAGLGRLRRNPQSAIHNPQSTDTIWALRDVSFEVKRGEVVGVIGRNGAGKSTLLKILSRITEPTAGRAEIHGRVGSLLEVGTGFHPELTGRENIFLSGALLGMRREEIDRQFDEIVDFSGVEKFIDTPVKRFSSGMNVRLGFAVAAHLQPEILLIDEVLAVGDAAFQKKCLGKMGDVAKQGRTVLFISHNMIAVRSLCPNSICLDQGVIRFQGPSSDVVSNYLELFAINKLDQTWTDQETAPGNNTVRLRRVWLDTASDLNIAGVPREETISIGVEYWLLNPTVQIDVELQIFVDQQIVAFVTSPYHDPSWKGLTQRMGLLRCQCKIPAYFLNTGQYSVDVLMVKDRSKESYILQEALSFDVIETEERSNGYFGRFAGAVRPDLDWEIEYLGSHL